MTSKEVQVCASEEDCVTVDDLAGLDAQLDRLTAQNLGKPIIVEISDETGDCLSIGVGQEKTLVHFVPTAGPYWVSVGDAAAEGTVVFYLHGEWTEVRKKQLISVRMAREAVRHWYSTGAMLPAIRWSDRP